VTRIRHLLQALVLILPVPAIAAPFCVQTEALPAVHLLRLRIMPTARYATERELRGKRQRSPPHP
jgi:hypothetical protein